MWNATFNLISILGGALDTAMMIAGTQAMPASKTSMALDYENGRPMEIEALLGNTVRAGRKAGVAMPALESIYELAKMVEGGRARSP